jgi:hypothetical protein
MIGDLLGHTQVQTTQRCALLLNDPLCAGLEQVGDMLRANPKLVENAPLDISPYGKLVGYIVLSCCLAGG